jgi:hypothetical protein
MRKAIRSLIVLLSVISLAYAADDVAGAVHGTVKKVDSSTKTIVVKTDDGAEHTLHLADKTAIHGAKTSAQAGKDTWHGLSEGTEVVAHYTQRAGEDTAVEIDKVGHDGLKSTAGTIKDLDRGSKKLVVKADDGTESTFRLTDHAVKDSGKDIAEGTEKGAKVTVYYTEEAGKKVAHFFKKG